MASPVASFTYSVFDYAIPVIDVLNGTASTGTDLSYHWNFGDGATQDQPFPDSPMSSHIYSSAGTYTVTLTVTDAVGGTDSVSHDVALIAPITPPPVPPADVAYGLSLALYESDNDTLVDTLILDVVGTRQVQDTLNQFGSVGVQEPILTSNITGTSVNTEATDMTRGRILRASLGDLEIKSGTIRARSQVSIDSDNGEKSMVRTVTAPGWLSEWDRAVYPQAAGADLFKGATVRHHGWMSAEANTTSLDAPTPLRAVLDGQHPDPWIWLFTQAYDASTDGYFIIDILFEDPVTIAVHNFLKNFGNIWLNGVPAGSGEAPPKTSETENFRYGAVLPGGMTHRFAYDISGLGGPETCFAMSASTVNDATTGALNLSTFLFHTGVDPTIDGGTTQFPWKCSATPHGCTALQIIKTIVAQVQTEQGRLTDVTIDDPGGDGSLDSNGNAFDLITDVPIQVGIPMGSGFLYQLAKSFCDFRMSVDGKTLYTYRYRELGTYHTSPDTMPVFSGEIFGAVDGRIPNIVQLEHEEKAA